MTSRPFRSLQIRSSSPISVTDVCSAQLLRVLLTRGNGSRLAKHCQCSWRVMSNFQDSCASAVAPTALEMAYQFGLTRNSHMSFAFDDTKVRERFVFRMEKSALASRASGEERAALLPVRTRTRRVCAFSSLFGRCSALHMTGSALNVHQRLVLWENSRQWSIEM